jgi:hypothetical protein
MSIDRPPLDQSHDPLSVRWGVAMQLTLEQANIIQQGNYTNINDVAADALQLLTQRWYNHTRGKAQLEEIKGKK